MKKRRSVMNGIVLAAAVLLGALLLSHAGQIRAAVIESRVRSDVAQAYGQGSSGTCPVDFQALQRGNCDIYAWLYIPGAGVSEPVLCRDGDSTYYAGHNSFGGADPDGALFTDSAYNTRDFRDPATVIYGKNTWEGRLFSGLQAAYSSSDGLLDNSEIILYLPDKEIRYTAFAAAPFRNYNIPYYFNFNVPARHQTFLDLVHSVRTVDSHWNDAVEITTADQMLILSAPRNGSTSTSYLVLAKRD